ncbi:MAG TPA: ABC transporter ATP-binding protein [bacterium]|nr:ABC transporter ATP-binding protein [bacterium]
MIAVDRLIKRFGAVAAVDGVSFAVARGEIFGLLGPDGAGKTTLFRILAGVMAPTAGTARVAGADIRTETERVRPRIGYMPQAFALYGDLTVSENLRFVAEVFGVPRVQIGPRLARLLQVSRLERFTLRRADHLSGGMKQKLALAATLLHEPDVLLLDEPTTGVDPLSRREFWQILQALNREGKTIVVATPYMDEAERCARVALMHRGRVLSLDAPGALRARFPDLILEIIASPRREALAAVRRLAGVQQATVFGEALHVVVPPGTPERQIADALEAAGIRVATARRIEPSLEDVFVFLLGRSR